MIIGFKKLSLKLQTRIKPNKTQPSFHVCRASEIMVSVSDFSTMSCKPREIVISSAERWKRRSFVFSPVSQHARLETFTSVIDSGVRRALYPTSFRISLVIQLTSQTAAFQTSVSNLLCF